MISFYRVQVRSDLSGICTVIAIGSHDHTVDYSQRGLKLAAKDSVSSLLGMKACKAKHMYGHIVGDENIPENERPTLSVSITVTVCLPV